MKGRINQFLNYFIHDSLKADEQIFTKIRMLQAVVIGFFIVLTFYTIFFWINGSVSDIKSIYNYIGLIGLAISVIMIKVKGSVKLILISTNILGFFLISVSAYLSGGIYSYDLLWYLVLFSSAFLFIDKSYGFIITGLCVLALVFFYLTEVFNWVEYPEDQVTQGVHYRFLNISLVVIITGIIVFVLVRGNSKLQLIVDEKKEKFIRNEIARDFHDEIGNKLASINQLSAVLEEEGKVNAEALKRISSNSKEVYENFRDFLWYQSSTSNYFFEIFMYLRDFGDDFFKYSKINFFAEHEILDTTVQLPASYSREVLYIFKEFMVNSYKYSEGNKIYLKFKSINNQLFLFCKDDGIGFDTTLKSKGMGLMNMQTRAQRIGADFNLLSENNKGVQLELCINLPQKGSLNNTPNF